MKSTAHNRGVTEADAIKALISSATAKQEQRGNNNNNNNKKVPNNNDYYRNTDNNKDNSNFKRQKTNNTLQHQQQSQSSSLDYYSRSTKPKTATSAASNNDTNRSSNQWGKQEESKNQEEESQPEPKVLPNFALSGTLTKDVTNNNNVLYNGIVLKFSEPIDAKTPSATKWGLYVFKPNKNNKEDAELLEKLSISKQSAYLFGREKAVSDILVEHSSLSRQHCVLQYRSVVTNDSTATNKSRSTKPYLMDLESANGTFINGNKLQPARYYELKKKDVITLGFSTREYVLLA